MQRRNFLGGMAVVMAVAWGGAAFGAEGPSFELEENAWLATDVVVAAQAKTGDGTLMVLERWKGAEKVGAVIRVKDLPVAPLEISKQWQKNQEVKSVTGRRVVLFLKGGAESGAATRPAVERLEGVAVFGGARVSAAWIEGGKTFAFQQIMNPGPTELEPLYDSEAELKRATMEIVEAQEALAGASRLGLAERVVALKGLAFSTHWHVRQGALAALGASGKGALPTLRGILGDDRENQEYVVRAIAAAAGEDAGKELTAILQEELAYWKKTAPGLKAGWWNADPDKDRLRLQNHYDLVFYPLNELAALRYQASAEVVTELHDLWKALPQLNEGKDESQIGEACVGVLKGLALPLGPPAPR